MKKYYITFGGQAYDSITEKTIQLAKKFGSDEVLVYDDYWLIQQPFYKQNKWLWDHHHKRGFGWYCWKPYIIWKTLEKCNIGDVVLYVDADTYPIYNLNPLYDICKKDGGIMLFAVESHKQCVWCKSDCYIVMGQLDLMKNVDARAGVARFMLFEKGPWKTTQFLMEWLTYCINPIATTFDTSILADEPSYFTEHRTEQAIMSNLAHKYNLELYREADETGQFSHRHKDLYPQTFIQQDVHDTNITREIKNGSKFRNVD
jgi:hypothetical protein